ncbi:hypothetical protein HNR26_003861 [Rhizobium rosettiformans]|uniref:Uncharacterized protein n=2 Tax=Rhizobium rosettiformans TaxID=1368430 RepID=A0A4S8PT17_9HYPH|nr:hypothetical protein [Rhizobium rosettiformans]MBB5277772.1 hypothetical protein [Rhizobium rosettiformans]THV32935.1 hypothetical protein FAA86_18770 [Rhizobium rosettiformans W3]
MPSPAGRIPYQLDQVLMLREPGLPPTTGDAMSTIFSLDEIDSYWTGKGLIVPQQFTVVTVVPGYPTLPAHIWPQVQADVVGPSEDYDKPLFYSTMGFRKSGMQENLILREQLFASGLKSLAVRFYSRAYNSQTFQPTSLPVDWYSFIAPALTR